MEKHFGYSVRVVIAAFGFSLAACGGDGSTPPSSQGLDRSPDPVSFADPVIQKMAPGLSLASSSVTVKGIDADVTIPAMVDGGLLAVNGNNDFVEGPVDVRLDDEIRVLVTAPDRFGSSHAATLTVGEGENAQSAKFTLKTDMSTFTVEPGFKSLTFRWNEMAGVDHYELYENADGVSEFTKTDLAIAADANVVQVTDVPIHLTDWNHARFQLHACNEGSGCLPIPQHELGLTQPMSTSATGYMKSTNPQGEDIFEIGARFGDQVALSGDGNVVVVSAPDESSSEWRGAGAVYVYERLQDGVWREQAVLTAPFRRPNSFGYRLKLSADGATLAVAAVDDSSSTGIDNSARDDDDLDMSDTTAPASGAVHIFHREADGQWFHQAFIKNPTGADWFDDFGWSIDLNADGNRLVIGAVSDETGNAGNGCNSGNEVICFDDQGAAYVYQRNGNLWAYDGQLLPENPDDGDLFGYVVMMNGDGGKIFVGALDEDSVARGVDYADDPNDNLDTGNAGTYERDVGAIYLFEKRNGEWRQSAYLKPPEPCEECSIGQTRLGAGLATNIDGSVLAAFAPGQGRVYLFSERNNRFSTDGYLVSPDADSGHLVGFGVSLAFNLEGTLLAIGAAGEDGIATGVDGVRSIAPAENDGAVYLFQKNGDSFEFLRYIKSSGGANSGNDPFWGQTDSNKRFGESIALSGNGETLVVGAPGEDDAAAVTEGVPNNCGVDGDESDCAFDSGAVYIF